ncbi:hypothetical protein K4039_20285 [Lyngbya sp. CCAP 1446/10]|uniref:hypothetical protein n=1 Tax=Lyngbya sp. CCAP 1446/10 TaxID=439293 RepID=UPI002237AC31|nr:hypothetical protein [Lyngbya sp. CCAP 1446/10]MCW6052367.1 hypothetical protein [Lyngbya sp. CCAP 1446/10]
MESLEALVKRHFKEFPEFHYYGAFAEFVSAIESYHQDLNMGVSSDCCNSLLQSLCKTIITQIDSTTVGSLEPLRTDQLIKKVATLLQKNDDVCERDFASQLGKIGVHINAIRNNRGELSHGRCIPKELLNDQDLSRLLREITESLSRYLISSFFIFTLDKQSKEDIEIEKDQIRYEENSEFNDLLDEEYPLDGKLLYSQALYTLYYEDYNIRLQTFLYEQALLNKE